MSNYFPKNKTNAQKAATTGHTEANSVTTVVNSFQAINAQEMPLLLGESRQNRGCGHRRTGIVANRGGSSYSGKEAEIEGVRDRCILKPKLL